MVKSLISKNRFNLTTYLERVETEEIDIEIAKRELLRNELLCRALRTNELMFEVFSILITPPPDTLEIVDSVYGRYKLQYLCTEIALSYTRQDFQVPMRNAIDRAKCFGIYSILFNFCRSSGDLDTVLLISFCKVSIYLLTEIQPILIHLLSK